MNVGVRSLFSVFVVVALAAAAGVAPARADGHAAAAQTKAVIDDHLADFGKGDVDAILANYAADAVVMVPGKVMRGPEALRGMFEELVAEFGQPGVTFEMLDQHVAGDMMLLVFRAETAKRVIELGNDTFIVRDGKIAQQTIVKKYTKK